MANSYLNRTTGTATNTDKCTLSVWIKRSKLSGNDEIIIGEYTDASNRAKLLFNADQLHFFQKTGGSTTADVKTTRVFRDASAWYHIVVAFDTTQSTNTDRIKFYINGVQETAFDNTSYPSSGQNIRINESSITQLIGYAGTTNTYFDGSMSHIHFTDGYAYAASTFGETDSTTGEWKINTSPSVTYGNNGFFILKDGNSVTDQSGNSASFTTSGTLTKTEDCPSNVFATFNPLDNYYGGGSTSNGNTTYTSGSTNKAPISATLGASSGKYYWEVKPTSTVSSTYPAISVVGEDFIVMGGNNYLGGGSGSKSYITFVLHNGNIAYNFTGSSTSGSYGNVVSANDIVGVALDLDNGKIFFSINGTWQNSGDPANGTNPANSNVGSLGGDIVFPALGDLNYSSSATFQINFGNGYFGTTAVASAGTNASGNGIFEYDVPTGYTALSTKGLNL